MVLSACNTDGSEAEAEALPVGEVARIEISPEAVLLTEDLDEQQLQIRAFDAEGDEIRASGLEFEWTSTDENEVALVPIDGTHATVSRVDEVGSTVVVARVVGDSSIVSNPVLVHSAVLHDEVVTLADEDIVFPPLGDIDSPADLLAQPGFHMQDEQPYVGEFPLLGLLAAIGASDDEPQPMLRYPVVIRREAYVEGMTRVLGSGSSQVYGEVIEHEVRGEWVALLVEGTSPSNIYEAIDIEFDGEALDAQGLLNMATYDDELDEVMNPTGGEDEFRNLFNWIYEDYNDEDCATGKWSGFEVSDVNINVKPKLLPPVYQFKMEGFGIDVIEFDHGLGLEAIWRPQFDLQIMGEATVDCYTSEGFDTTVPIPLFGLPLGLGLAQKPKIKLGVSGAGGPRLNAYFLKKCVVEGTYGFRWEDGGFHSQNAEGDDYFSFTNTCFDGNDDLDVNLTISPIFDFNEAHDIYLDLDLVAEAHMGLALEQSFSIRPAGGVLNKIENVLEHAQIKQDLLELEEYLLFLNGENPAGEFANFLQEVLNGTWLKFVKDKTDLRLLSLEGGLGLNGILSSPLRLLNGADAGYYHANENQALGVQLTAKAEAGLLDLTQWLNSLIPHVEIPSLSVTIEPPPFDLLPLYRGIEGYGDMKFSATKGPGNTGFELAIGDTIHLDIPGVYGAWTLVPSGLLVPDEVYGGEVVWRSSAIDFEHVAWMEFSFVDGGNTMRFTADIELTDQEFVDYLNFIPEEGALDDKELFFLSYNRLWPESPFDIPLPGYLGSMSDFSIEPEVDIQGIPATFELSAESLEETWNHFEMENVTTFAGEYFPIQMKAIDEAQLPVWLTVDPLFEYFVLEGQTEWMNITGNCPEVTEPTILTHALDLTFAYFDIDQVEWMFEKSYTVNVELECLPPDPVSQEGVPMPPPLFVGTQCPANGAQVDYAALDAELFAYQNKDLLQYGVKLLPASGNVCLPAVQVELPVPCFDVASGMDYRLWKMGGSVSFNDLGLLGTPYFVWNPHYLLEGMWEELFLISAEPVSTLSYAQETAPLKPCDDARMDPNSGPHAPVIDNQPVRKLIAYPTHVRPEPDLTLPEGYQECYDLLTLYGGNDLVACSESTTSGALYMVIQPDLYIE